MDILCPSILLFPRTSITEHPSCVLLASWWALKCLLWGTWHSSLRFVSTVIARCTVEKNTLDTLWLGILHPPFCSVLCRPSMRSGEVYAGVLTALQEGRAYFSRRRHWSWIWITHLSLMWWCSHLLIVWPYDKAFPFLFLFECRRYSSGTG